MAYVQGGAKVGLQMFIWKIIQSLINNDTRINCCILPTVNLLLPHPAHLFIQTRFIEGTPGTGLSAGILRETTHQPHLGVTCSVLFVLNKSCLEFSALLVHLLLPLSPRTCVLTRGNELVCASLVRALRDLTVPATSPSSPPPSGQSAEF